MATNSVTKTSQVANSLNEFSWDLYRNFGKSPTENLFFSPYSIMAALTMVFAGASNNTAEQMSRVLRLNKCKGNDIHDEFQKLNELILSPNAEYTLKSVNRLYCQKDSSFLKSFLTTVELNYQAKLMPVDFQTNIDIVRTEINNWVSEQTNNKINNIIAPGVIDSLTVLVLVNAIYFEGNWMLEFDPMKTSIHQFIVSPSESIPVDMMYRGGWFGYFEDQFIKCQVLSLPYQGETLHMVVVLPDRHITLADLESKISVQVVTSWCKSLRETEVHVSFPRFKLEECVNLKDHLSIMGMPDLFNFNADLSRITESKDTWVSNAIHKAFVEVNEEGTEAAAVTCFEEDDFDCSDSFQFIADRPFLFFISNISSGSILFLGRVINPPSTLPVCISPGRDIASRPKHCRLS